MLYFIGVVLSIAFIVWLIRRAAKKKVIKAYMVLYGLSCITGIFTLVFFLTMDISTTIKILVCIIFGGVLIFLAARLQQRRAKAD